MERTPTGELVIQSVAMPADTNANGDMFGGWLVSQMDIGGAVMAIRHAKTRITTVAIDKLVFIKPVYLGDLVSSYASVIKTGRTSITILLEVWVRRQRHDIFEKAAEGVFTYVALDEARKPTPVDWMDI